MDSINISFLAGFHIRLSTWFQGSSNLANDVVDPGYLVVSVDVHTHLPGIESLGSEWFTQGLRERKNYVQMITCYSIHSSPQIMTSLLHVHILGTLVFLVSCIGRDADRHTKRHRQTVGEEQGTKRTVWDGETQQLQTSSVFNTFSHH